MEDETTRRGFYLIRHEEDIPQPGNGMLIPPRKVKPLVEPAVPQKKSHYASVLLLPAAAFSFIMLAGLVGIETFSSVNTATISQTETFGSTAASPAPLNYGVAVELAQPTFFAETRDAFIDAEKTFIEVDLTLRQLRYFVDGILVETMPVLAKGESGSLWQTPSGLYSVEQKKERYFSTVGQVYLPFAIVFQGNFFIHGWPEYAKNKRVEESYDGGGVRLATEDAERLYELVKVETTVLVHEDVVATEQFVYEPKVPELKTPHYLVADVESSTVLASSNLTAVAPIASVAKLMTALVAAEHINLDSSVYVNAPTFVQSLVPRLGERSRVSMYSLLQLLLVESSNEAAEVIAAQLGQEEFVAKMNEKALTLGMVDTHFADPSGLSSENTASLSDLLRLAQYIFANRSFIFEITANQNLKSAHVGGEFGELSNFNKVAELDNFIGGKVGETIAAGQTSVSLHKIQVKGTERIIAIIILGSENRNDDVTELLRYAEERFGN